jgi:hypothetical protein
VCYITRSDVPGYQNRNINQSWSEEGPTIETNFYYFFPLEMRHTILVCDRPLETQNVAVSQVKCQFLAVSLLSLIFDSEDGGSIFLRNVVKLSPLLQRSLAVALSKLTRAFSTWITGDVFYSKGTKFKCRNIFP